MPVLLTAASYVTSTAPKEDLAKYTIHEQLLAESVKREIENALRFVDAADRAPLSMANDEIYQFDLPPLDGLLYGGQRGHPSDDPLGVSDHDSGPCLRLEDARYGFRFDITKINTLAHLIGTPKSDGSGPYSLKDINPLCRLYEVKVHIFKLANPKTRILTIVFRTTARRRNA